MGNIEGWVWVELNLRLLVTSSVPLIRKVMVSLVLQWNPLVCHLKMLLLNRRRVSRLWVDKLTITGKHMMLAGLLILGMPHMVWILVAIVWVLPV